jgi:hypothetical protein
VALKQGDKALVGNKGFRKYLRTEGKRFEIDEAKLGSVAEFVGKPCENSGLPADRDMMSFSL